MIISDYVTVKWRKNNKEWYESKGYVFTDVGNTFAVYYKDLIHGGRVELFFKCDYCGDTFNRNNREWRKSLKDCIVKNDACSDCRIKKMEDANMIKYGVKSVMQVDEFKDNLSKTMMNRYGKINYSQTDAYKEKFKKTSMEKFGVEHPFASELVKEKSKVTNLQRYGVPYSLQNKDIKQKAMMTLTKNNLAPTSKQQTHIHSLVGGKLNHVVSRSWLDIAFEEDKIYLEYDGGGHDLQVKLGKLSEEEFNKKEKRRYFLLKDYGWKEIRIISSTDKLHNDEKIKSFVEKAKDFLLYSQTYSIRWDMDNNEVSISYKDFIPFHEFMNKRLDVGV